MAGTLTNGFYRGEGVVLKEHEVARLDISMQDVVVVALCNRAKHCAHVACHLSSACSIKISKLVKDITNSSCWA